MDFIKNTKEHAIWIAPSSGIKIESFENGFCYRYSFNKKHNTIKKQKIYIYKERSLNGGYNKRGLDEANIGTWWIRLSLRPVHAECGGPEPMLREEQWNNMINVLLGTVKNDIYYFTKEYDNEVLEYFISKLEKSIIQHENVLKLKKEQLLSLKNNGVKITQQRYGI